MPRYLPNLSREFKVEIDKAVFFVRELETASVVLKVGGNVSARIEASSLELAYELAYLRIFVAWETFLEQVFLRLMCGYVRRGSVQEPLIAGTDYCRTILIAERRLLGSRQFVPWHNPNSVLRTVRQFFLNGGFELVISSAQSELNKYAAIRHRVAHAQDHARKEFDRVSMSLTSRRYKASRPGRLLRDNFQDGGQPIRWLVKISYELLGLAR